MEHLRTSVIRINGGTQSRPELDEKTVAEYEDAIKIASEEKGKPAWPFPPVVVFYDGESHWLADGFHRLAAAENQIHYQIPADIIQGTRRDAILYAAGANAAHGLRRSRATVQRQIKMLLNDPEWSQWGDREIARRVKCDHKTVGALRKTLQAPSGEIPQIRTFERGGKQHTMNTAAIGSGVGSTHKRRQFINEHGHLEISDRAIDPNVAPPALPVICPECSSTSLDFHDPSVRGKRVDIEATCNNCSRELHWFSFIAHDNWEYVFNRVKSPSPQPLTTADLSRKAAEWFASSPADPGVAAFTHALDLENVPYDYNEASRAHYYVRKLPADSKSGSDATAVADAADDFLDRNLANMEAEIEEMLTDAPTDFTSDMIDYLHNTERTITGSLLELDWSDADDKRIVLIVNNVVLSIGKAINELKKL